MGFATGLFLGLGVISIGWIGMGWLLSIQGGGLGMAVGFPFFLCTGAPAALVFLIIALICYSMYTSERRHQEMLAASYARNDMLGNMATIQLAQAQMQHSQMTGQPYAPPHQIESPYQDEWERDDNMRRTQNPIKRGERIITQPKTRKPGEYNQKGQSTDDAVDKIRRRNRMD
jgi:hypothetical protein